jgi:hypothetical protein
MFLGTAREPEHGKCAVELGVPRKGSLTKSVEGLVQLEHLAFPAGDGEARRLRDVDFF